MAGDPSFPPTRLIQWDVAPDIYSVIKFSQTADHNIIRSKHSLLCTLRRMGLFTCVFSTGECMILCCEIISEVQWSDSGPETDAVGQEWKITWQRPQCSISSHHKNLPVSYVLSAAHQICPWLTLYNIGEYANGWLSGFCEAAVCPHINSVFIASE